VGGEVDGDVHDLQKEEDERREKALTEMGLRVVRFGNDEVMRRGAVRGGGENQESDFITTGWKLGCAIVAERSGPSRPLGYLRFAENGARFLYQAGNLIRGEGKVN